MGLEKKDYDSEGGEEGDIITWDDLEDAVLCILSEDEFELSDHFNHEIEDLGFSSNWKEDQDLLDCINNEILNSFKKDWNKLNTIYEQNSHLRTKAIHYAKKANWNQAYFKVGNREIRKKVFRQQKKMNYAETFSVSIDVFEKNLFEELLQFKFGYWVVIWVLRAFFDDAHENDFPAQFNFYHWNYINTEFQLSLAIDENDEEAVDTLMETIDEQKKYLELENNLVTKLWDRTSRELFEKGYNFDMISEN